MNDPRNKHAKKSSKTFAIDGISPSGGSRNRPADLDFRRASSYQPERPNRLDDFNKKEGLQPLSSESVIEIPSRPRPVRTSHHSHKRRRFGLFRRGQDKSVLDGAGRRRPLSKKKKILRGLAIAFLILLLIVGFLFAKGYINLRKILPGGGGAAALQENVDPTKLRGEGDGRVNILMLGRGGEGHEGADLTDTLILVSIDPIEKQAALVSIPRDLYVKVPEHGSMKINSVFYAGKAAALERYSKQTDETRKQAEQAGLSLIKGTVEKTLGIPIHYNAMVDFTGFKQAIDTVGGININAPTAVRESLRIDGKTYLLDVKPGPQQMDGFKALAYSRSRYTSARGDFDRSERQRLIIIALKEKVLSLGTFSNPSKISQLLGNFGNHIQTDFSVQDLSRLYDIGKEVGGNNITSIGLVDPPHDYLTTSNIGGLSVVIPKAGVGNYAEIQSYIRNTLKDSFLKNENATVMVLNGTNTPGLATARAEELKSYGYNVTAVDNAPTKDYTKTVLVDLRSGQKKYTKRYLEQRLKLTAVGSLPDANIQPGIADFVIIVGSDSKVAQ